MARQRYRVVEKIDMGGMAEIYRGFSTSFEGIQKEVAIKRVLPQLTRNRKFVAMFLDEARLSMNLNHANIVQVFDVGRADGTYFIVMEFVDGYNLRRFFQRASEQNLRIPVEIAVFVMMEVCKGLAHAHEKRGMDGHPLRIVHRDVSPPNVLISKAGEVKLTDFGLAKAVTQLELTDPGVVKGKFSYLSPEAAEGKPVDLRADIFAVGTVLFELLTNRRLFLGRTDLETVEMVRKAEVPSASKLNPAVPKELERILHKALARDPKRRYPSARDMANALADFLFEATKRVTSLDLGRFVQSLFTEKKVEPIEQRIDALIQEEIINLSSLGLASDSFGGEGTMAVRVDELSPEVRELGALSIDQYWPEEFGDVTALPERKLVAGPSMVGGERTSGSLIIESGGRRGLAPPALVGLGVALFAIVFAVAYFFLWN